VLVQERHYDDAEHAYAIAREIWIKHYGAEYSYVTGIRSDLALIALSRGTPGVAETELRAVLADREKAHEDDMAMDEARLGEAERRNGHVDAALEGERAALSHAVAVHGEKSWESALAERYLGLALADAGQLDDAEKYLRAAIDYYDGLVGEGDHPLAATARLALGEVIARHPARRNDAIAMAERAMRQRERLFGASDARTKEASALLADLRSGEVRPAAIIAMADP
jgi:tetratricopeptide (TPR) repeat protein